MSKLDNILAKIDPIKTPELPEGNPFLPGNLSVAETKQQIKALMLELIDDYQFDINRLKELVKAL